MLRALLIILAIIALPLQGMAVPHSHPGQAVPIDHDQTPHVHLYGHSHGHSHHTHDALDEAASGSKRSAESDQNASFEGDGTDCDRSIAGATADADGLYVNVYQLSGLAQQHLVRNAVDFICDLPSPDSTEMLRAHHSAGNSEDSNILCCGTLPLYMATLSLRL